VLLPVLILVAGASFLVRLHDPIYQWHAYFGVFQLQPADVPRDLACFTLGVLAYRNNWLLSLPKRIGYRWLAIGVAGIITFVVADLSGHSFFSMGGSDFNGVVYPIWETFTCFGLCFGLPTLFREYLDFQTPFLQQLSLTSYGVYLFHLPMVVALQYALADARWPALVKFLVVAGIALPTAFLFTLALRRWRPVQRII
jgi:peptidoglycan/LPS O-acetylase OafA/YrhL